MISRCQEKKRFSWRAFESAQDERLQNFSARNCASRQWFLLFAEPDIHLLSLARRPSQKIEFVFSASLETIRREPQEITLRCSVGY